ncbi:TPA: hypothetical protein DDW35_00365 [Candidatus Sumerlaeota bacterium]|jgi:hypothetical protein|nr:hypothetical protein [Candidatus Sumerlaeota bacterium]
MKHCFFNHTIHEDLQKCFAVLCAFAPLRETGSCSVFDLEFTQHPTPISRKDAKAQRTKKTLSNFFRFSCVAWLFLFVSFASAAEPTAELALTPAEIFPGEPIQARLTVRHLAEVRVYPFLPPKKMGEFELLGTSKSPETKTTKDGQKEDVFTFKITCFEVGDHTIPPLEISYSTASDKSTTLPSIKTAGQHVTIKSAVEALKQKNAQPGATPVSDESLLRPVPPPMEMALDKRPIIIGLSIALAVVLLAILAYFLFKRFKNRLRPAAPPPPPLPPDEEALTALSNLEREEACAPATVKEFYTTLSEITRRYLGRRYRFDALEMTTEELLREARSIGWDAPLLRTLAEAAAESDSVKFAKMEPGQSSRHAALERARQLVLDTRPAPQSVTESEG